MADYDLGTARGVIEITTDTKGIDAANAKIAGVGKNAEKQAMTTKQAMNKVGTGMLVAGGVIAGGLALAVKTAANFEKSLSGIAAVSGETADGMQKIRDKALQIGKDTKFSAGEAASAIEELAKAGVSTTDILNGAADATVALAAAGEVDLPFAASIASNAMNQFNLTAEDMVGVTDSIAGAANASAIDVNDFGMSLAQVGAVANLAGLSFDDTAVAIAEMGNAGIKGSDAGTSLKSMLMRLQPQTKKQVAAMKELGIITEDGNNKFYDAQGNLKSLGDIQAILAGSLKGMTKEQKQATLQTLFGSDAIRAASVLANEGAAGYDKMAGAIGKTSAAEVAAKRMDNLAGSFEQLKGSLETFAIQAGSVLLPVLKQIVDALTGVVNWFVALPDGVKQTIVVVATAAAAFLLVGGAIIKIVGFAQNLIAAIKAIGLAMNLAFSANPVGLIIIGIIALVAAIIWLWNNCETFRNIVIAVWDAIKTAVLAVWNWFKDTLLPGLKAVWDAIVENVTTLKDIFTAIWNGIVAVVQFVFNAIKAYVEFYINAWKFVITNGLNIIKTVFTTIFNAIKAVVEFVWNAISAFIKLHMQIIKRAIEAIKTIVAFIRGVFQRAYDAIKDKLTAAVNFVKGIPGKILGALGNLGQLLWNAGSRVMSGFLDGLKAGFKPITDFVGGIASWIADNKGPKQKDLKLLTPHGKWIMAGFEEGLNIGAKDVQATVKGIVDTIDQTAKDAIKQRKADKRREDLITKIEARRDKLLNQGGSIGSDRFMNEKGQLLPAIKAMMSSDFAGNLADKILAKGKGKGGSSGSGSVAGSVGGTGGSGECCCADCGGKGGGSGSGAGGNSVAAAVTKAAKTLQESAKGVAVATGKDSKRKTTTSMEIDKVAIRKAKAEADAREAQRNRPVPHGAAPVVDGNSDFARGVFGGGDFNVVVNNPVPEKAGDSITRAIQKSTYLGFSAQPTNRLTTALGTAPRVSKNGDRR